MPRADTIPIIPGPANRSRFEQGVQNWRALLNKMPTLTSRSCRAVLFVCTPRDNPQRIIRQRSLQCFRFVPWCAHPHVAFLGRRQDHRHGLRVDRLDDRIRCRRQKAVDQVRAGDRPRLSATIPFEFAPDTAEREQRPVLCLTRGWRSPWRGRMSHLRGRCCPRADHPGNDTRVRTADEVIE